MANLEQLKALELEPGKTYAIECEHILRVSDVAVLREDLKEEERRLGCKFLLLQKGFRIAQANDAAMDQPVND